MRKMKLNRILPAFLFVLLSGIMMRAEDAVVTVRAIEPENPVKVGEPTVVTVELSVSSPYHINSDRPLQDYLIPTTLEIEPQPDISFVRALFPPAEIKKLPIAEEPLAVFQGKVKVAVEIVLGPSIGSKNIVLQGGVHYQACDNKKCYPPAREPFSLALTVEGASQLSAPSAEIPQPGTISSKGTEFSPPSEKAPTHILNETSKERGSSGLDYFGEKGLAVTFLLVFLGGLALNLTPCVYPMIPITISYFGGQAQGKKGSILAHASLYTAGMAITYSVLGVIAATTGGLFGSVLQYPPVLAGLALVMVLLALSMFDVYELRMPAFLNRAAANSQKGFLGTFFMGMTVGIAAAPCIGPFVLGLLTYVGNRGNAGLGFALFFILALGLGIPFLFLGVFSGNLRRLPRSGAWMVWVRKIFGFILLAMAVYFLKTLLPDLLLYHLMLALLMLLAGIYLAWIDPVQTSGRVFLWVRNMVGILFFAASLFAAFTGLQETASEGRIGDSGSVGGVQWLSYSDEIPSRAIRESKPALIDFYADWCAPCRELDKRTFGVPEVIELSREFIMLKVDLTTSGDAQAEDLRQKYRVLGVPTLVFLNPDGREISELRITGFEPKEVMLDRMNRALRLSSSGSRPSG